MDSIAGLTQATLHRARLSRDPRFDGRFFIGVSTTGIYCRSICPSRTSRHENVHFFGNRSAAEAAGYRPCRRCRPEAAPGSPAWVGTAAVVGRALRLIERGALDEGSVLQLSSRLGIGPRQLDKLFARHVGAGPIAVAQTRRVNFAKQLLDETDLPVTQVALSAGFRSTRRFNDVFKAVYHRTPRQTRASRRVARIDARGEEIVLHLAYRPPYDWDRMREFLARRAIEGMERVDEKSYMRTVMADGRPLIVRLAPAESAGTFEMRVWGDSTASLMALTSTARRVFDLSMDPTQILESLRGDAVLGPLVRQRPGLRIPGAWDPLECTVRSILGQHLSTEAGRRLIARLVHCYGERLPSDHGGLNLLFPTPEALLRASPRELGIPTQHADALRALARGLLSGRIHFDAEPAKLTEMLSSVPCVGPWTIGYITLRAFGDPDALPSGDLLLRRALAGDGPMLTVRGLEQRAESWRPWRAYAAMHLWTETIERAAGELQFRNQRVARAHAA